MISKLSGLVNPEVTYKKAGYGEEIFSIALSWYTGGKQYGANVREHKKSLTIPTVIDKINQLITYAMEVSNPPHKNTHTYKGKNYRILSRDVKIQVSGEWVPAVSYTNSSEITFVRTADEFDKKFKELL